MTDEARVVPVELDPELHIIDQDLTDAEKETWAVLDTAYNLLRDHAAKKAVEEVRRQAKAQGIEFPDDAVVFAQTASEGVAGYRDLAVNHPLAARGMVAVYEVLLTETLSQAEDAINGKGNH